MIGCTFRQLLSIVLVASISHAGTLDLKLVKPQNGEEYYVALMDKVGPISMSAEYAYREIGGIVDKDRGRLEVDYNRSLNEHWNIWFFNQASFDKIYNTRDNKVGIGPEHYILRGPNNLSVSTGILYDYNHITDEGHGRYSHRVRYAYEDSIEAEAIIQPRMDDNSDYIESYRAKTKIPNTANMGSVYCLYEKNQVGIVENECGLIISMAWEDENGIN